MLVFPLSLVWGWRRVKFQLFGFYCTAGPRPPTPPRTRSGWRGAGHLVGKARSPRIPFKGAPQCLKKQPYLNLYPMDMGYSFMKRNISIPFNSRGAKRPNAPKHSILVSATGFSSSGCEISRHGTSCNGFHLTYKLFCASEQLLLFPTSEAAYSCLTEHAKSNLSHVAA